MKYLLITAMVISTICCTKETFDPRTWSIGEQGMAEEIKFTSDGDYNLVLSLENDGFCLGAYNFQIDIRIGNEIIYDQEVSEIKEVVTFEITKDQSLQINTELVTGDPQINCFRLGNVKFTLEEQ